MEALVDTIAIKFEWRYVLGVATTSGRFKVGDQTTTLYSGPGGSARDGPSMVLWPQLTVGVAVGWLLFAEATSRLPFRE